MCVDLAGEGVLVGPEDRSVIFGLVRGVERATWNWAFPLEGLTEKGKQQTGKRRRRPATAIRPPQP